MAGVKEFEEYDCWKLARELANRVYTLTREDLVKRDYGYVDQIRRASVSVMNNIAEGHERGSNRDFVKFLYVARGSAGEVRNMLYVGLDQNYIDQSRFEELKTWPFAPLKPATVSSATSTKISIGKPNLASSYSY